MKYLVDANVLSEPTKPDPDPRVVSWLREHESEFVIDPVILGEVRYGILLLPDGKRRERLERWFDDGIRRIHCVAWDSTTGLRWARLLAELRARGQAMPVKDSMIAATALEGSLTLVTRNRRDFAKTGVEMVDPFSA